MRRSTGSERLANAAILVHRRLLFCYPKDFRENYGAGMERMFREQAEEACGHRPVFSLLLLLVREVWGILRTAPVQRFFGRPAVRDLGGRRHARLNFAFVIVRGEVRHALRSFRKRPGFALTVIVQLGLGIGAATTILTAVDNVLMRGLPYPRADELTVFSNPGHSYSLYVDWRDRTNSFASLAAVWDDGRGVAITGSGLPENASGARVTSEFFQMFGAAAFHGRLFIEADFLGVPTDVVVVSHALWQMRWGGTWSSDLTLTVDGNPTEVIGVLDPTFQVPDGLVGSEIDIWMPLQLVPDMEQARTWNSLRVVARRKPNVGLEAAQAEVDALATILAVEHPATDRLNDGSPRLYRLIPLFEAMVGDVRRSLFLLLGAVTMMLLIACSNVTNLVLAREMGRSREWALRAALGAGRGRISMQLTVESLLLALAAGAAGAGLAVVGIGTFEVLHPGGFPRVQHIAVDARVLSLSFVITLACAVLIAGPSAIALFRSNESVVLKTKDVAVCQPPPRLILRKLLVVTELASGVILLVGAGLLFQSLVRLRNVDGGFSPDHVLAMPLQLGDRFTEDQRVQFAHDLLDRIEAIPGVVLAGAGSTVPPYRKGMCCWFQNVHGESGDGEPVFSLLHPVTPGYFEVLGARILRGRGITEADRGPGPAAAVISETLAGRLYGRANPIGKDIRISSDRWRVVGVVNDIRHWGPHREAGANVYIPHARFGGPFTSLEIAVKSELDPALLAPALRDAVWAADADLPVPEIAQLEHNLSLSVAEHHFLSTSMVAFALFSVVLAAGGIYGYFTFSVRQRYKEFGIRTALGAGGKSLVTMVLRNVLLLTLYSAVLGLGGALVLSRLMRSALYGVSPTDPTAFAGASAVLVLTALVASFVPAYRASKTDPVEILRVE